MRVERLPVGDGLAHDPTHELEVRQVLRVHVGHRVGLEGSPVSSGDEQGVVLVEDVSRQDGIPVDARARVYESFDHPWEEEECHQRTMYGAPTSGGRVRKHTHVGVSVELDCRETFSRSAFSSCVKIVEHLWAAFRVCAVRARPKTKMLHMLLCEKKSSLSPLAGKPAGVDAVLVLEGDVKTTPHLLRVTHPQLVERILEHLRAARSRYARPSVG